MGEAITCWCGGRELRPFGAGYVECVACATLVRAPRPGGDPGYGDHRYHLDRQLGLADVVLFAGHVPDATLAALLQCCLALVFPSRYEGFGLPVAEAMVYGRPVLLSDLASLREVAGDAAIYFDPCEPAEIAAAIERVVRDPQLVQALSRRSMRRAVALADPDAMARAYLAVFDEVVGRVRRPQARLAGVWSDGWTGPGFAIRQSGGVTVQARLCNRWNHGVTLRARGGSSAHKVVVAPGQRVVLELHLPPAAGEAMLSVSPTVCPLEEGLNQDGRHLGLGIESCRLLRGDDPAVDLLEGCGG